MRVLVANYDLSEYGGTQTWTYTVCSELERRGHDVSVFALNVGPFDENFRSVYTLAPPDDFDVLLINHHPCLEILRHYKGRKIFTSHGPSHPLEWMVDGADKYVAVSEEVANKWWFFKPDVIRNPIDTNRFKPEPKIETDQKVVLSLCKNVVGQDMVREACHRLGFQFDWAHRQSKPCNNVELAINRSDIVVTYGRGAYEALACDKPVLVFDARAGEVRADGWLRESNVRDLVRTNCSGRTNNLAWTVDDLTTNLGIPQASGWGPEWVKENHDVEVVVDEYLLLAQSGSEK